MFSKFHAGIPKGSHGFNNVFAGERDMLHAWAIVIFQIFFDLRFPLPLPGSIIGNRTLPAPFWTTLFFMALYWVVIFSSWTT